MKKDSRKKVLYSSLEQNSKKFAKVMKEFWGIENSLHWVLDIAFDKDDSKARIQNSAENLTILRELALNVLKNKFLILK